MINRTPTNTPYPLNITGSSTFGRYPKISLEKTYNMFVSDQFSVPYAGYKIGIENKSFLDAMQGRALHASVKLNKMIGVFDQNVFLIDINFNQVTLKVTDYQVTKIGELQTNKGVVYITENNKPQICISDGVSLYVYDTTLSPSFQTVTTNFIPGYIDFHDTYILCAATADGTYSPPANNTWRLSGQNDATTFPDDAAHVGLLETKPDNTQAVVRFPSKGNLIFVFGRDVVEPWYDVGYQLFPYQRNTNFNCDFGCLNPATIASLDTMVVWLAINEKSGPVVMYSDGGEPIRITTDGFDYVLSNLQNPSDAQAFMFRQDGHIFYHINFYTDNLSFYIDFLADGTQRIYHACDENNNYYIASEVAFFNNQYYFISRNNGNLYVFDTRFTTYDGKQIPRIRVCKNVRNIDQTFFVATDVGFTIESGNTNYYQQSLGNIQLTTVSGDYLVSTGGPIYLTAQDGTYLLAMDGKYLVESDVASDDFDYLVTTQEAYTYSTPRVDLSISVDGGENFSSYISFELPPIGKRTNRLKWWQLGIANDLICQFRFYGFGRFVCTDGEVNTRQ